MKLVKFFFLLGGVALYLFSAMVSAQQSQPPLADRHVTKGMQCEACHISQGSPALKMNDQKQEPCVGCHGWYDAVGQKTQKGDAVNPHAQHDGNLPCTECHKGHRAGVNYCAQCHAYEFNVP